MPTKANLEIGNQDVTAYFHLSDGRRAVCHYCGKPGVEQLVVVEEVLWSGRTVNSRTKLYRSVKKKLQRELLHRRGLCELGSPCDRRLQRDRDASREVTV